MKCWRGNRTERVMNKSSLPRDLLLQCVIADCGGFVNSRTYMLNLSTCVEIRFSGLNLQELNLSFPARYDDFNQNSRSIKGRSVGGLNLAQHHD